VFSGIDGDSAPKEKISYLTNVLDSYSTNEQRGAPALAPAGATYRQGFDGREAAAIESLIWGWQNQPYGVPWWRTALRSWRTRPLARSLCRSRRPTSVAVVASPDLKDEFTFEPSASTALPRIR